MLLYATFYIPAAYSNDLSAEKLLRYALASEQRLLDFQLSFGCSFTHHLPGPLAAGFTERKHTNLLHAKLLRLPDCHALPKRHLFTLEIRAAYLVLKQRCEARSRSYINAVIILYLTR